MLAATAHANTWIFPVTVRAPIAISSKYTMQLGDRRRGGLESRNLEADDR
jgi:hypothetical protein